MKQKFQRDETEVSQFASTLREPQGPMPATKLQPMPENPEGGGTVTSTAAATSTSGECPHQR